MKTITFYSYKGGVGRSLALVNIATRLAEFGKKVCVIDFDLEAPGLHFKFPIAKANLQKPKLGIVDFVYDFANMGMLHDSIKSYSTDINISKNGKSISLITAGNTESIDYWKKLSSINWYDLIYENKNGLAFFLNLKELIKKDLKPDFLLIDSRTGISEMSGITLSLMAEEVVIVAANNKENLNGASKIIKSITNPDNNILGNIPNITFVLSRIPFTDKPEDKSKELFLLNRIKREYLHSIVSEINIIHSDRELEEFERVKIAYEKDESNNQTSIDYLKLFEKLTKNDLSQNEIKRFNNIREAERLIFQANNSNNIQQRLELIEKAMHLNKNSIEIYMHKASILKDLRKYDLAIKDLEYVLNLNETNTQALNLLVDILIDQEKYDDAEIRINRLLEIRPHDLHALLKRGVIYSYQKKLENAEKAFSEVIEIAPDFTFAYSCRGNIRRVRKDFDNALEDIYKALELDSENIQAIVTLSEIYAEQNKNNDFYIHFENALKMDAEFVSKALKEEDIYEKYANEERFEILLSKYDVFYYDEE